MGTYFGANEVLETVSSLPLPPSEPFDSCLRSLFHFRAAGRGSSISGNPGLLFPGLIYPLFCFSPQGLPPPPAPDSFCQNSKGRGHFVKFPFTSPCWTPTLTKAVPSALRVLQAAKHKCQPTNELSKDWLSHHQTWATTSEETHRRVAETYEPVGSGENTVNNPLRPLTPELIPRWGQHFRDCVPPGICSCMDERFILNDKNAVRTKSDWFLLIHS